MPSLFRLIIVLAVLAAVAFAGMLALVTFVEVKPHTIEQAIPPARLK